MSGRVIRAVLRNPALRRVQLAFLAFNAAEYGTWVAILLYGYSALGAASVGLVALAQLAPAAAFAPVAASLADRFPRERVLLAGYLLLTLGLAATAAAMLLDASPILVIAFAAAASVALTFARPTQGALLPGLSRTPEELTAANGVAGTAEGAGLLLGPLAAAGLLSVGSPGLVFAAGAVASLAAAISAAGLPARRDLLVGSESVVTPGGAVRTPRRSPITHVIGGLRAVTANRDTGLVVLLLGLRMLTVGAVDVLLVLLALEVFDTGESGAGILSAAMGLGTVVGGAVSFALVGRQRLAPALAVSALAWGAALVAVGTVTPALLAPVVIAAGSVGLAACDVAGRTILQRVTDDRTLARVLGALEGVGLTGLAIGSLLVPVLAGAWGPQVAIIAVGAILPVGVALAWAGLRAIDRRVRVPVREVALLRDSELLAPLAPPELERVAARTRWMTAERGDVVIREGETGDRYYVLETGALLVTQHGRYLNRLAERGTGFGEIALLHDVPRTATVSAEAPSVLLVLERVDFLEAVTGHDLVRVAAERVATTRERVKPAAD